MTYNNDEKEKIYKALELISEVCAIQETCPECPFYQNGDCLINTQSPNDWTVSREEKIWRALQ